jgi:hypothetical protein
MTLLTTRRALILAGVVSIDYLDVVVDLDPPEEVQDIISQKHLAD